MSIIRTYNVTIMLKKFAKSAEKWIQNTKKN